MRTLSLQIPLKKSGNQRESSSQKSPNATGNTLILRQPVVNKATTSCKGIGEGSN